jgi:hypothetical protein
VQDHRRILWKAMKVSSIRSERRDAGVGEWMRCRVVRARKELNLAKTGARAAGGLLLKIKYDKSDVQPSSA